MSKEVEIDSEILAIVEEGRSGFNMRDRLKQRVKRREGSIVIYTDEQTAEILGDARDEKTPFGPGKRIREGVIGELDAATENLEKLVAAAEADSAGDIEAAELRAGNEKIRELRVRAQELKDELEKTALDFTLAAIPSIIEEACGRQARSILKIKGNIPEALVDDYNRTFTALVVSKVVTSLTDRESGETLTKVTYQDALDLKAELPPSEWRRLDAKVSEIQYKQSVGDRAVEDATFLQAG